MKPTIWTIEPASVRQHATSGYIVIWQCGRSNGVHSWQIYSKAEAEQLAAELNEQEQNKSAR